MATEQARIMVLFPPVPGKAGCVRRQLIQACSLFLSSPIARRRFSRLQSRISIKASHGWWLSPPVTRALVAAELGKCLFSGSFLCKELELLMPTLFWISRASFCGAESIKVRRKKNNWPLKFCVFLKISKKGKAPFLMFFSTTLCFKRLFLALSNKGVPGLWVPGNKLWAYFPSYKAALSPKHLLLEKSYFNAVSVILNNSVPVPGLQHILKGHCS